MPPQEIYGLETTSNKPMGIRFLYTTSNCEIQSSSRTDFLIECAPFGKYRLGFIRQIFGAIHHNECRLHSKHVPILILMGINGSLKVPDTIGKYST